MKSQFFLIVISFLIPSVKISADEKPLPIRIGATLPLTGNLAFSGNAALRGFELGIGQINREGGINGRNIELLVEDNGGDANRAVTGVSKLIDVNKVDVVFSLLSHISQAVSNVVLLRKKLYFYIASITHITNQNPLAFKDFGSIEESAEVLFDVIPKDRIRSLAIISEQNDACVQALKRMHQLIDSSSVKVLSEDFYTSGEVDFRSLLLRAGQKKPDAFMICAWRDSGLAMVQLKKTPFFSIPTFQFVTPFLPHNDTPELRKLYEENKTLSVWSGLIPDAQPEGESEQFVNEYRQQYHEAPRLEVAFARDDIMLLAQALRKCAQPEDTACLVENLKHAELIGTSGKVKFNEKRLINRPNYIIRVENGRWVRN